MSESPDQEADITTWDRDKDSLVCPTCGRDDFASKRGVKVHHKKTHNETLVELNVCKHCNQSYQAYNHPNTDFCSLECYNKFRENGYPDDFQHPQRKEYVEKECGVCSKTYEVKPSLADNSQFCSVECQHKWQKENMVGEKHPCWNGGYQSNYGENWLEQRDKARERDNHTCQGCGLEEENSKWELSVHHITPKDEFESLKEANKLSNLVTLCRTCHGKWEGIPLKPTLLTTE